MGRPLNKKYFGNTNYAATGEGVGGEGVASVTIVGEFSGFTLATTTVTFSAPQITGGQTATGTATIAAGAVTAIVITNSGSGYTAAPTVTIADSDVGAEVTTGTATAVLTVAARSNGMKCEAQVGAGSEVTTGDIIKQSSARRYKVQTSDGVAVCKLVTTAALSANEMSITATDSDAGTYFVKKLTAHQALLIPIDGTQFASGTTAKWTFGSAVENTTVTVANQ
jgi:hypothetical protein